MKAMKTSEQIRREVAENNAASNSLTTASEKQILEYLSANNIVVEEKEFAESCKASLVSINGEKAIIIIQSHGNYDECTPDCISWNGLLEEFNNL